MISKSDSQWNYSSRLVDPPARWRKAAQVDHAADKQYSKHILPCLVILEKKRVVVVDFGLRRESLLELMSLLALNSPSPLAFPVTSSAVQDMCVGVYRACPSWLWSSKRSALISSFASQAMQEDKQSWKKSLSKRESTLFGLCVCVFHAREREERVIKKNAPP